MGGGGAGVVYRSRESDLGRCYISESKHHCISEHNTVDSLLTFSPVSFHFWPPKPYHLQSESIVTPNLYYVCEAPKIAPSPQFDLAIAAPRPTNTPSPCPETGELEKLQGSIRFSNEVPGTFQSIKHNLRGRSLRDHFRPLLNANAMAINLTSPLRRP